MTLDTEHLKRWIGRKDTAQELLTQTIVERFNATFDRVLPVAEGDAAPLMVHFCLCQPSVPTGMLATDGHPEKGGFLPPVPLPRRMWAGGEIEFHRDIRVGDMVSRVSEIANVQLKEGKTGPLCFVTVNHQISANGQLALLERQDIVYREAQTSVPAPVAKAADPGENTKPVNASAPFLFRYSALTFNAHRIHYDAPYATAEEHYPGLVVHGPVQATLLCQFAADLKSQSPMAFAFRSSSPLFGPSELTLNATQSGAELKLWTAAHGGPAAMKATARW
jgi:3-methylfumaryl-CoA hydratase